MLLLPLWAFVGCPRMKFTLPLPFTAVLLKIRYSGILHCVVGQVITRVSRNCTYIVGSIKVTWIKGQRISWLGHLERMVEDRMPKKIFTQELEGTRRSGRPRKRWKEEEERDL